MTIRRAAAALATAAALEAGVAGLTPAIEIAREAYLMGTRAVLVTYDVDRPSALSRLDLFLEEIEAAERELSTWQPDSELSWLNASPPGARFRLSPPTCALLADVWRWSRMTGGAFDPVVGPLIDVWDLRGGGRVPGEAELAAAVAASGTERVDIDAAGCTAVRRRETWLDSGAFGKGEALDRVRRVAGRGAPWLVDLGGQIAVGGAPPGEPGWRVGLAHPRSRHDAVRDVILTSGSLAVSGGSERDRIAGGRRVGHILDPRTGHPARFDGAVAVWHERALAADILSTALYVMGPDEGLVWAETAGVAAAYLLAPGTAHPSVHVKETAAFRDRFPAAPAP